MRTGWILAALAAASLHAQSLRIYAIDVEGGKATLYLSPSGESMLFDAGYEGNGDRDARRIAAAARSAGVKRIDALVISHFHADHVGGVAALAARMPVGRIFDHGSPVAADESAKAPFEKYAAVRARFPHTQVQPGDSIPVKGMQVQVVAVEGKTIVKALDGAGQENPLCASYQAEPPMTAFQENQQSMALVIGFGKFRAADFGDLFWNVEHDLACPANRVGTVDLLMTTHHGDGHANSPQMVYAMHPLAAIMNNGGERAGASWSTLRDSPGLADIWQLHFTAKAPGRNPADDFIANRAGDPDGKWIEVAAQADGSFTVRNARNQFAKTYRR